ncbi:rap guanine nucleotide exchange factor 4 [Karstenula rhodostoma CBS 690.94]|uniref:Rap guanine nucleotide exchange factor 4 n=1 Tax=Karstenula rhodostoma CBS 690.94 TaxID=1392251 RepID=A0A9P4PPV9_9PLEO|nr:rap guanine nucleotide exchange factor 4 [Karstenula rhodostoma CBS 690.94]
MPPSARPPSAAGQARGARPPSTEHRNTASRTAHQMESPRKESVQSAHAAAAAGVGAAGLRPPNLKNRAHSAPMVPKSHHEGSDDDDGTASLGEGTEDWEIAGDEFFQRYHFPEAVQPTKLEISSSEVDSSSDTEGPLSPTSLKGRHPLQMDIRAPLSPRSPAPSVSVGCFWGPKLRSGISDSSSMQDINIAVLGARGSGKSTFIRHALNLPAAAPGAVCTRKMTIDGGLYVVRFLEMSINDVQVRDQNCVKWPDSLEHLPTPRIDGAVTIYDVTSEQSLARVPEILGLLSRSGLPFVLVGCKCDHHPAHRKVDPAVVEKKAKTFLGEVNTFQTSEASPDAYRGCLSVITRAVISSKRPRSQASMARRRANSSAVRSSTARDPWDRKHERANSEFSARLRPNSAEGKGHRYKASETNKTFFNFEEESPTYESDESDGQADNGDALACNLPSDENGYTFDQLVDRLLAQPTDKKDTKFGHMFLALYRKFATPGQLLEAILKRFEALKRRSPPVLRIVAQLRYLTIMQQWTSYYPGDFAYPSTRRTLRRFATALAGNREFAVAAAEILHDYEAIMDDDDTDWACSDRLRAQTEQIPTFHTVLDEDSDDDDFTKALGHMSMSSEQRLSIARSSMTGHSRSTQGTTGTTSSTQTFLHQVELNERLARHLVPNPIKPLTKLQWRQFMEETEEAIAKELTRIDWIMFSSIRPRDLIRHVSMSPEEKKRFKSLENVTRMTDHFNHVHFLVQHYILMRDKHRHRALMLEKWMKVARELRKLNNYNSLGAVLAGINSTAVHRLAATRELVPQQANLDFMKLEILMGQSQSYKCYRLAWDNSARERLPYLPLHRRDLVTASEGNATFVTDKTRQPEVFGAHPGTSVSLGAAGNRNSREAPPGGVTGKERINWKKFELMGDVIVRVQRAQGTPYPTWRQNDDIKNLILDIKIMKDEEELYDRSLSLEAAGAGEKKKFASWWRER